MEDCCTKRWFLYNGHSIATIASNNCINGGVSRLEVPIIWLRYVAVYYPHCHKRDGLEYLRNFTLEYNAITPHESKHIIKVLLSLNP